MPPELSYIALAERFGCSPAEVLAWPEEIVDDVALYMRVSNANAAARRRLGV